MTFLQLYGDELDRELGTADRGTLFTVARRKAAINAAQAEWVKQTECLQKQTTVTLVSGTQEYDLEATISDFGWIAKQGLSIQIVNGTQTRYIEGTDLIVTTVERLNAEEPGWRAAAASLPMWVYPRRADGAVQIGFHPAPSFTGETWTVLVPYVVIPTDLSADADVPFTVGSNPVLSLRPWHRALVFYAAAELEKYRKDTERQATMLQFWQAEYEKFLGIEKPKQGRGVRFVKEYRQRTRLQGWQLDVRSN